MSADASVMQTRHAVSPVATEALTHCPACGSGLFDYWLTGRDRLHGITAQTFEYSKCRGCSVVFLSQRPIEADIGVFYGKDYAPHGGKQNDRRRGRLTRIANRAALAVCDLVVGVRPFRRQIRHFYSHLAPPLRFLDFGCGAGEFLDKAKKLGCETIGMDFSVAALERVAKRGHRTLLAGDADWDLVENGSIGFVRMNHVIEHLYQPKDVLKRTYEKMAPGARLHVATPNPDCASAEEFRECWFSLDCPRHVILFPPGSLIALAGQTGFVDIRVVHEPLTKDIARSFAYRAIDGGKMTPQDVGALSDDGFLNLRFSLRARSAVLRGRSDRIHVLARKPLER